MAQRTVGSPVNIYVKEREMALTFGLHGELNALLDTVQVVQEVCSLSGICGQMMKVSSMLRNQQRGLWGI
jgi:hypothetical protein